MNKKLLKKIIYIGLILTGLVFTSCYQPNPLTGTWADNRGDQITLFPDYKFAAKITDSVGNKNSHDGTYNVLMNAITFTAVDGYRVVSEWDVRGSMLYLKWPDEKGTPLTLILYKIKN